MSTEGGFKYVRLDAETHAHLKAYARLTHRNLGGAVAGLLDEADEHRAQMLIHWAGTATDKQLGVLKGKLFEQPAETN